MRHLATRTARLVDEVLVADLVGLDAGVTKLSLDVLLLSFEIGLDAFGACLPPCRKEASSLLLKACSLASCMSVHAWMESAKALTLPGNLQTTSAAAVHCNHGRNSCTTIVTAHWSDHLLEPGTQFSMSSESTVQSGLQRILFFLLCVKLRPADACLTSTAQMYACKLSIKRVCWW